MDKIDIPASITIERSFATQVYKWKSNNNKKSVYRNPNKRAFVRFSCKNFADKINKTSKEKRQISIKFSGNSYMSIKRIKKGISVQGYSGEHPYIQIIVNKVLPSDLWEKFEKLGKKTLTLPVNVRIDLSEWKDLGISHEDFILEIEKEAKILVKKAIERGFNIKRISKGREYDVSLIHPNGKEFIIAISSHVAKTQSRSKEKTVQKILMDISKMLPYLSENKRAIPVIITRPIDFKNSWSFTTDKYLNFYKEKFGFKFLTTEFKNNWEDNIIKDLLKI